MGTHARRRGVGGVAGGVVGGASALALSGALTFGLPPGAAAASAAGQDSATAGKQARTDADSSSAPLSEDEARAEARRTGESVEIAALRGESSDVFATPEGDLEAREYLRPVRARVGGAWKPIDTDLADSTDGMVAPKVTTVGLAFSGGGDDRPLVRMTKAGRELALSWPGKLPEPRLNGATATYTNVLPDVDLRMGAQEDGFTQLLVVKSAKAAASSELTELKLNLSAVGLDTRETAAGGLEAADKGAKGVVFEAPKPMMWDSSSGDSDKSGTSDAAGGTDGPEEAAAPTARTAALSAELGHSKPEPGAAESGKLATVDVDLPAKGDALVLKPDQDVLAGKDTTYPVFIDPQWYSPRASTWTMASKYWAGSPQWKFNGKHDAGLGYCGWSYCAPHDTKRLFYQIPTAKFAGKSILSAEFVVRNVHSASCSKREVQLWRTKGINNKTTWNSQSTSGFWEKKLATESFAHGASGCGSRDAEFNIKSAVQEAADKKWSNITFGMKAASESDKYGWKRFSDKAYLRVKYNRPPSQIKMSQLTMEYGGVCKKPGSAPRVRTLGKIYANNITDPDKDSVSVQFEAKWDAGDGKGLIARWKPARTSAKKSGSNFSVSLPKSIPANKQVHWYVRSYDGAQYSPWSWAGDPTGCYFVYDTGVPKAPAVSSGEYPASDPGNPDDPWFDGVGQYGSFSLKSSSTDVTRYRYGINADPSAKHELSTSGGAAKTAKILPGRPGLNFVTAQAFDKAGNASEVRTYQYRVKAGQPERATWQMDEGTGATESKGSTPARTASLHGGAKAGVAGKKGAALHFDGNSGYAKTDIPVVNTDSGFSVSTWVKLDKKPDQSAIALTQPGNHSPGFELYYSKDLDRWVFNQYAEDKAGAGIIRAMADKPGGVKADEWQHLVGAYDSMGKRLQLYVDGKLTGEADLPKPWNARRGLQLGAGSYSGKPGAFFPGAVDDVQIFDKKVSANEVAKLHDLKQIGDPGRPAVAVFPLDEPESATVVEGHGDVLPAKFHGGVIAGRKGVAGNAVTFNGTDGYARIGQSRGPHVNTSRSFTISTWAKLDRKPSGPAIITAQAGEHSPGFELYYSKELDRWAFNQYAEDKAGAGIIRAMADKPGRVKADEWVQLTGVHDTVADTLTLYINGQVAGSTKLGGAFRADGSMFIGAGNYDGKPGAFFPGEIDDVRLYDRPVSADEARQLFQQRPLVKGRWKFDATESAGTPDDSEWGHKMTLGGSAAVDAEGAYMGDSGLVLNGSSGYAATSSVPVDTGTSFTATAWARAASIPKGGVSVVSAAGSRQSAFSVRFVPDPKNPDAQGRWELAMPDKDGASAAYERVTNSEFYDVREWNHLAVVYDGFAKQARLYINGMLQEVACSDGDTGSCEDRASTGDDVLSFKAVGSLQVGRAKNDGAWSEYFGGNVDDVWVFQGALNDSQIEELAGSWFDVPTEVPAGAGS
ncbi:LamG-like jellyroll fold domain-containing protein [Streptomyces kanamyceticus]|uniref:LamG domain-containing protein n=1 Tax=Streptomyces kanamyceticus TaxID=1967 RepID=A0A5J6GAA8_STRKN|nr:LamG-like jellyroll fold domain-containing protein [Streptomyces kanamyceticus]QEU90761.1 LamG domain-containing protein [Streptomyces kanamyceticus]